MAKGVGTNRLAATLGVTVPVVQSGMGGVAGPELAAAVSNAGGLGVLAALNLTPDRLRASIAEVRRLTSRPFGVNIWLHDDVRHPPDPNRVNPDVIRASQAVLNELRPRFDLPTRLDGPPPPADLVDAALEVMIEERIPVFSTGLGVPEAALVERFHAAGTAVLTMVATVTDAQAAVDAGCDVVVAQGSEAGGHRSHGRKLPEADAVGHSTLVLVPAVVDALAGRVPVVAAGGIVDGRGLAAMVALGADGVLLGTRFVATRESLASPAWKARLLAPDGESVFTDGFTGQWARVVRSTFTDHWRAAGATPPPGLLQAALAADLVNAARAVDDDQMQPLYAGAGAALITDLPSAGEVVARIAAEAGRASATMAALSPNPLSPG